MTVLQTADGRLLRARPAGIGTLTGTGFGFGQPSAWPDYDAFPGRYGAAEDDVLKSFSEIYRSQPIISAVVDKLARRIATLPFDGYQRDGDNPERVRGDSLDTLLHRPVPRLSGVHLLHHVAWSMLVHGNALVAKVRGNDPDAPPIHLWPLDWSRLSAYAPEGGMVEWWSTIQFGDQERFLAVQDTVHFAWSGTHSEIGVSPLEKLGVTIRLEDAAQRYQTSSFRNGVRPGGLVTLPPGANPSPEVMAQTRRTIDEMHKGVDKAFRIGLLAPGADWKAMSMSAVEAELISQRKLNREEVGMVFDLAGPLMNDLTHGTYSNIEELNKGLYRDVLPPWLALIEQTFQVQLIDPEPAWINRFAAFDLADKLKGDPRDLAETLKLEVEAGLITRNEARRILNLPPDGDPDDPSNPANQLTANVLNNQAPLGAMDTSGASRPEALPES